MVFFFADHMEFTVEAQLRSNGDATYICYDCWRLQSQLNAVDTLRTPFFSAVDPPSQYLGLMLIAHHGHGEVYVPSSD